METKKFKSLLILVFVFTIIFSSINLVLADSNGVWTLASDIRGGTFGVDEAGVSSYTFENSVAFNALTDFSRTIRVNVAAEEGLYVKSSGGNSALFDGGNFIISNGKVGIGTINPQAALDVYGGTDGGIIIHQPSAYPSIRADSDSTSLTISGGNSMFGNPKIKLESNSVNQVTYEATEHIFAGVDSGVGGTFKAVIKDNGYVGLGTSTPTSRLEVNGDITLSGSIKSSSGNVVIQLG